MWNVEHIDGTIDIDQAVEGFDKKGLEGFAKRFKGFLKGMIAGKATVDYRVSIPWRCTPEGPVLGLPSVQVTGGKGWGGEAGGDAGIPMVVQVGVEVMLDGWEAGPEVREVLGGKTVDSVTVKFRVAASERVDVQPILKMKKLDITVGDLPGGTLGWQIGKSQERTRKFPCPVPEKKACSGVEDGPVLV